jgi:hypothetical protein
MTIKEVKKNLGLTDIDIANIFGYENAGSYRNSSKKPTIEKAILTIYSLSFKKALELSEEQRNSIKIKLEELAEVLNTE